MFVRRRIKEVRGMVFLDSNNNGTRDSLEQPLKDIGIRLFAVADKETQGIKGREIQVLKEKLIFSTKTNDRGEYRFLVREGAFSVSLDVDTLPVGKGVTEASRFFDIGEAGRVDFAVRDVDSVDIYDRPVQINIGEYFSVNPTARDKNGNVLSAKMKYLPESNETGIRSNLCRTSPKSLRSGSTNIIVDTGNARFRVPVSFTAPDICSVDKVDLAHRLGLIDKHTKIQHSLYALFSRRELSEDYHSKIPIKSGTGIVEEIMRYMESADADPKVVETARRFLGSSIPRLDKVYKSPSGYFNIHYTLSGNNAVPMRSRDPQTVPPYIMQVGMAFDNVKTFTCGSRGFREPVLDEGTDAFDVYVCDLKGKYGMTYSKSYSFGNARTRVASCYICIDNNYSSEKGFVKSREDCMKVTAAHEFFHAVQYAYNVDADSWWKEASATWNEDEVYTGVNDYVRYIGSYFSAPYKSLDESSYSGVVFAKFLSENFGGSSIIKRIWEMQSSGYNNSIDAIDSAISKSYPGQDIGRIFDQFSGNNVNPGQYYTEGALWKASAAVQQTYSNYPVAVNSGRLNHLSSNYQLFKPTASSDGKALRIVVDGADRARWGFKLQKRNRSDKLYSTTEIALSDTFNRAEITLQSFGEVYDEIYLIPANLEKERNGLSYTYSASME